MHSAKPAAASTAEVAALPRRTVPRRLLIALLALAVPSLVAAVLPPARAPVPAFLLAVLTVVVLAARSGWRPADLGLRSAPARWVVGAVPLGLLLIGVNIAVGLALQRSGAGGASGTAAEGTLGPMLVAGGLPLLLLRAVVLAPLEEELLFRGVLQIGLVARLGPRLGILLTALAFAAVHGSDAGVFHVIAGVVYGVVAWRSGSIWPAVILHALNNALAVLLVVVAAPP